MKNSLLKRANKRVSLSGAATLLVLVALSGQALGFLRNRLISTNITVVDPGSSDAFFAAFLIPDRCWSTRCCVYPLFI
jgi:peptidoglycan biosynthesis protein MviN/MurJ (putative lipid II flippase)